MADSSIDKGSQGQPQSPDRTPNWNDIEQWIAGLSGEQKQKVKDLLAETEVNKPTESPIDLDKPSTVYSRVQIILSEAGFTNISFTETGLTGYYGPENDLSRKCIFNMSFHKNTKITSTNTNLGVINCSFVVARAVHGTHRNWTIYFDNEKTLKEQLSTLASDLRDTAKKDITFEEIEEDIHSKISMKNAELLGQN